LSSTSPDQRPAPTDAERELRSRIGRLPSPCDHCGARSYSFCDVLEGQEFQRLAAMALSRSFAPHQTIVEEGQPADFLINVIAGTVKLYRSLSDGRIQIVGFLKRGDFLGIPTAGGYTVGAEAITPVETCNFARAPFQRVLTEFPTLERRLFDLASNEIAAARDHLLLLGRKTARERVASFLTLMASKAQCGHTSKPCVELPMTRIEIADYLGITMETVSRTLHALRNEGLIEMPSPTELTLTRADKLKAMAEGEP
jgi:CRP/FNR family transcriptional regulator